VGKRGPKPGYGLAFEAKKRGEKFYLSDVLCARHSCAGKTRRDFHGKCWQCKDEKERKRLRAEHIAKPEKYLCMNARQRARIYNLPFSITPQDIRDVWPKDDICPVLGIKMKVHFAEGGGYTGPRPWSPTIDRFRPHLGYVIGNIGVISLKANRIKCDETDPEIFRAVANWLEKRQ